MDVALYYNFSHIILILPMLRRYTYLVLVINNQYFNDIEKSRPFNVYIRQYLRTTVVYDHIIRRKNPVTKGPPLAGTMTKKIACSKSRKRIAGAVLMMCK
jgi:hypothetical protein